MRNMRICLVAGVSVTLAAGATAAPAAADAPTTTKASVSANGVLANGASGGGAVSADGGYIAFWSAASNLVPGDTNEVRDIFLRERTTGIVTLISVSTNGTQGNRRSGIETEVSPDGRYIVFNSEASNLAPGDTNEVDDIFLRDRTAGTTTRVSVSTTGEEANGVSERPALSADGRYIVFMSQASNLVPDDTNGVGDIFLRDRTAGTTTRVNISTTGEEANDLSFDTGISGDGRYIVFASYATNLVSGRRNTYDTFLHDRVTGITTRESVSTDGTVANGASQKGDISADGRYIVFISYATNLVPDDTNGGPDVFVRDRIAGVTTRASVQDNGDQGLSESRSPTISADGRYVLFTSNAPLVPGDTNREDDVFLRDRTAGTTTRVSVDSNGMQGNSFSWAGRSISADGRYSAFESISTNLVPEDFNNDMDVFIRDRGFPPTPTPTPTPTDPPQPPVIPTPPAPPQPAPVSASPMRTAFLSSVAARPLSPQPRRLTWTAPRLKGHSQ